MLMQFILFIVISNVCSCNDDLFTATSQLETLLDSQKRVVDDLNSYVYREQERLAVLKRYSNLYNHEQEKAAKDVQNFIKNPINALRLIRRLSTGLDFIGLSIKQGINYAKNVTLRQYHLTYPVLEDLKGATLGLKRLQETYRLKIHDLSQGLINGMNSSSGLSSDDCYEIGRVLYYERDLELAYAWMLEAHKTYERMDELLRKSLPFTNDNILAYIGNVLLAVIVLENMMTETNQKNRPGLYLESNIIEIGLKKANKHQETNTINTQSWEDTKKYEKDKIMYESLCRGEITVPSSITRGLKCWFSSKNHPFLKYAPIKVEQVYKNPNIYKFYDFVSDFETEHIISIAKPKLMRSYVDYRQNKGQSSPSNLRISKSAALSDEKSQILASLTKRINAMTGLNMLFAETFQVANYGIGGYYTPHYDFATPGSLMEENFTSKGNRIATVLLYLSDVTQGGATIFTKLGLNILPKKRMAVYWLNLHPSGDRDWSTIHAACPVLRGAKWVGTKWIHEAGQELSRPCPVE